MSGWARNHRVTVLSTVRHNGARLRWWDWIDSVLKIRGPSRPTMVLEPRCFVRNSRRVFLACHLFDECKRVVAEANMWIFRVDLSLE